MMKRLNTKKVNIVIYVMKPLILMKKVNTTRTTRKLEIIVIIMVNIEVLQILYAI